MNFSDPVTIFAMLVIGGAIIVGLVYLTRVIAAWYYKIDLRLNEHRKTNEMLEALINHYGIKLPSLTDNTVTVRIKESGRVITVGYKAWEQMKEEYGEDKYEVLD